MLQMLHDLKSSGYAKHIHESQWQNQGTTTDEKPTAAIWQSKFQIRPQWCSTQCFWWYWKGFFAPSGSIDFRHVAKRNRKDHSMCMATYPPSKYLHSGFLCRLVGYWATIYMHIIVYNIYVYIYSIYFDVYIYMYGHPPRDDSSSWGGGHHTIELYNEYDHMFKNTATTI